MEEFDYIILGAGAARSVLARRLSEDLATRVLVVKAGDAWIPANVDEAPLWFTLLGGEVDWDYRSVPQPCLGGRVTHEPRGKMPGGSNGTSHVSARGQKPVDDTARQAARVQARRVVTITRALRDGLTAEL